MASMGYSVTRGKLIQEKTRSQKSCVRLPLTTLMLSALFNTQLDLCDLCIRHEKMQKFWWDQALTAGVWPQAMFSIR
jgi:hypothetical protein